MPTGYTSPVGKSENYSFDQFVWDCARGFNALSHMRDSNSDAQITLPTESEYRTECLQKNMQALAKLKKMTLSEAKIEYKREYEERMESAKIGIQERKDIQRRYKNMLVKVKLWIPPSPDHVSLKDFMIQQLDSSIEFDCDSSFYEEILSEKKITPAVWLKRKIIEVEEEISFHTDKLNEERAANTRDLAWIADLQKSIPFPKKINKLSF